ncbi:MAG: PfaD family polyunsaturated fatty acid/polyketide biosynthesis protein [Proteobacteria bacterium]|nr:PfaD family polyunsaturated fatty acid/polyketide biosynthesis protein [Pseudomonadota bacterium]MBU4288867.1 PfaD family polyunsaturated fatty acid/polyketide biosynthesis protein [Pseudomonadota bacterium]
MISGWWTKGNTEPRIGDNAIKDSIIKVTDPVFLVGIDGKIAVSQDGSVTIGNKLESSNNSHPLYAYAPPLHPENLGDPYFKKVHNLRYAYIAGAMANGITSVEMVEEVGHAGMIGFFGAAGLSLNEIESAIDRLQKNMNNHPFGFNLINSPNNPELESAIVDLYLKRGIRLISASAYLELTLPLVYFRVKGIHRDADGNIVCSNKIIAKVSRVEVARKFFSPPSDKILYQLVDRNMITREEAALATSIPVADDMTAEADSGGHTDNSPAISLLPTIIALRDELAEKYQYKRPLCVGLGGGIATPASAAAAFSMGAAYILTGSINQSCVEAGTSQIVRQMLAEARQADVTMAPAADMFEMGVKVQVLKRGTMFPFRASKLYDLYCNYDRLENIPEIQKKMLEKDFFQCSLKDEWENTKEFFVKNDPKQIIRAEKDPKHKMALVFRSYLGRSSNWAITGDISRKIDYQIWCGPAMGAFNEWVKGSFLEKCENRKTVTVAMNLLFGAAVATRANWLRSQKISLPNNVSQISPMELSEILELLDEQ